MSAIRSSFLKLFNQSFCDKDFADQNVLWKQVKNPIIEDIPGKTNKLVTFLYRMQPDELDGKTSIYFLSGVAGYDFTEASRFSVITGTDIAFITLELSPQLRTAYNLVKLHDTDRPDDQGDAPVAFPRLVRENTDFESLLNHLFAMERVIPDPLNDNTIVYYKDMDKQDELYGKESILELPLAPSLKDIPITSEAAKEARDQLRKEGRLIQDTVNFSGTSLKDLPDYKGSCRKYWIYFPPNYEQGAKTPYPLMLFLDGSSYLDLLPAHVYLDRMIHNREILPCVAVFLDSADDISRDIEYNCHDRFTQFICHDFLDSLRTKHQLNITRDSNFSTIIGTSFSGLAAFYASIAAPVVFGHCISQSPALAAQPLSRLDKMIQDASSHLKHSSFAFEMGRYENIIVKFEYEDGTVQSCSSLSVVRHVFEAMQRIILNVSLHEFVGGHNYVCWQISLYDRLNDVGRRQLKMVEDPSYSCGKSE